MGDLCFYLWNVFKQRKGFWSFFWPTLMSILMQLPNQQIIFLSYVPGTDHFYLDELNHGLMFFIWQAGVIKCLKVIGLLMFSYKLTLFLKFLLFVLCWKVFFPKRLFIFFFIVFFFFFNRWRLRLGLYCIECFNSFLSALSFKMCLIK